MPLNPDDREFFRQNGYLVLRDALSDAETRRFRDLFDRDRKEFHYIWKRFAFHQTINCDALVTTPEFDELIRHPKILPVIDALMGGPTVFSEICIRHMNPFDGEPYRQWHRDRPPLPEHPLKMDYLQLMVYLTDVDESTHCFSISPQSADDEPLGNDAQLERGGIVDIHGPAGTICLFAIHCLHTATVRVTQQERKTVQIYYGHRERPYLSNDSVIPARFWRDHPDSEVRAFYGKLNPRTHLYLDLPGRPSLGEGSK